MSQTLYEAIYNEFKQNVKKLEYDLETVEECQQCRDYLASLTLIAEEFFTKEQLSKIKSAADRILDPRCRRPGTLWVTYRTRFAPEDLKRWELHY